MSTQPPPIQEQVIDEGGILTLPWILFMNNLFTGDRGTDFTPVFTNLTTVGTPTLTGRYIKIGQSLAYFWLKIVPSTSTTAVAGTTYINNFPLTFLSDGICFAVSGLLGSTSGHITSADNRIYVPAWSAVTVPLTIVGIGEVR